MSYYDQHQPPVSVPPHQGNGASANRSKELACNFHEKRRKMVASAFGEDQSGGSATRLTVEDHKYLFML